jgi:alkanesulfonate monooxygenase SsuD/methylene tetrahydromethanopterin reductase-like flavin-dependent oxidoreductase (luciferase family)
MKFGLIVAGQYLRDGSAVARAQDMLEQVRLARQLGFDSVWMVHHYLIEFQAFQPVPMLARLAAEAGDMEIGTAIYVLPLQHPVEVAENFATLDALSGGRLVFGVAQGYRAEEFEAMGVPRRERAARFDEGLRLIERLWTEDGVDFDGRFYRVRKATLAMRPVRQPRPPIWIGATAEAGIERAAGLGDAWMIGPGIEMPRLAPQLDRYRGALRRLGRAVEREYPIFREVLVCPTEAQAQEAARRWLRTKYEAYFQWGYVQTTFDEVVRDAFVVGDPAGCARQVRRYRDELGMTHLLARVQWPGVPQDVALRGIRLLGEQVIPAVRSGR